MSDIERDDLLTAENPEVLSAEEGAPEESATAGQRRKRPWWHKLLIGLGSAVVALVLLAGLLYAYGGMGSSANDPAMKEQFQQLVASGQAQPVEKRFVIPIPGCTCHSTDPVQTEVHRYYRMRECSQAGCHGGPITQ